MNRRQFLRTASSAGAVIMFAPTLLYPYRSSQASSSVSQVVFVKTNDRASGVIRAIDLLETEEIP